MTNEIETVTTVERSRRTRIVRFLLWASSAAFALAIIGFFIGAIAMQYFTIGLPQSAGLQLPKRPTTITFVSAKGEIMGRRGATHGGIVTYEEIPEHLIKAIIAIEDQRFFSHFGIDLKGLSRALYVNYQAGSVVQGGSTLTQQLAKNLFLSPDRTIKRKIQEAILALRLEASHAKEEILEQYLNRVYFGAGTFGIEAASQRYFGKSARELSLGQAAMIAGLVRAPSRYAPTADRERAIARAQVVLNNMLLEGYISQGNKKRAEQVLALPRASASVTDEYAPYALDWIAETISDVIGETSGDLVVETTIDIDLQLVAEAAAAEIIETEGRSKRAEQVAVVLMTNDGRIKALVGGLNHHDSQFNRATKGLRQPGSTFKVFVYASALEEGFRPWTRRVDGPVRIGDWAPHNYSNRFRGNVTIDEALTRSINTVAVKVAMEIGIERVREMAQRLGIEQELPTDPTISLGSGEVTLVEMTTAFATLPNEGRPVRAGAVRRILSGDGRVLYERPEQLPVQVLSDDQVRDMNLMLSHVVARGTGKSAQIEGHEAAGKTGTTQSYRDAWFMGYTGHYTAGVWVGNDDNSAMERVTGGSLPAKIWHQIMSSAHLGVEPQELPKTEVAVARATPRQSAPFGVTNSQVVVPPPPAQIAPQRKRGFFDFLGIFGTR